MSQCKLAPAHLCLNLGVFSLWCVCRECPGLSLFSRVDGSCDTFLKRDNIEKVMRGESQFIKPFVLEPCKIRISLDSGGLAGALDSQIL